MLFGMFAGLFLGVMLNWAGTDGPIGTYLVGGLFDVGG